MARRLAVRCRHSHSARCHSAGSPGRSAGEQERTLTVLGSVSHFWLQNASFGLIVLAKHIKCSEVKCPFEDL